MTKKKNNKSMIDKLSDFFPKSDSKKLEELQASKRDLAGQIEDLKAEYGLAEVKMKAMKEEFDLLQGARRAMVGRAITDTVDDLKRLKEKEDLLFDEKNNLTTVIRAIELIEVAAKQKDIDLEGSTEDTFLDKEEMIGETAEHRKRAQELKDMKYKSEERPALPGALEDAEEFELSDEVKQALAAIQAPEASDAPEAVEPPEEE